MVSETVGVLLALVFNIVKSDANIFMLIGRRDEYRNLVENASATVVYSAIAFT